MFTAAQKTTKSSPAIQQKAAAPSFFRKAGEESFFGAKETPSFFKPSIQAKLTVSTPDDPHEKEADAVAEKVMRMPETVSLSALPEKKEEKLQRKEEEEVHAKQDVAVSLKIQCKAEPNLAAEVKPEQPISRKEDESVDARLMSSTDASGVIHRKNISLYQSDIFRQSGRGPPATSIPFEQTLASSKGGGSALPGDTQQFMESRFSADFSGVKIHTDSTAQQLNRSVHAQAFAHGNDIYFNSGKFSPNTTEGRTLLAHELTHTIQQGASKTVSPQRFVARRKMPQAELKLAYTPAFTLAKKEGQNDLVTAKKEENLLSKKARPENIQEPASLQKRETPSSSDNYQIIAPVVAPKSSLSSWNVQSNGNLNMVAANAIEKKVAEKEIQKKDDKGEEKEAPVAITDVGLQKKSTAEAVSLPTPVSVQSNNISTLFLVQQQGLETLNHVDTGTVALKNDQEADSDRGPPLQLKAESSPENVIQRSMIDGALGRIGEYISDIPLLDLTSVEAAKHWLQGGVRRFASYIPGYRALGVVLGRDPISGEEIARSGRNFIEAALDIIPGGNLIQQKLNELGLIDQAAVWIDTQLAALSGIVQGVRDEFTSAWNGLGLSSILDGPMDILRNLGGILERAITSIVDFARRAASELTEIVKRFLLTQIVSFIKEHTNAYELLKVIIGKDPVTDEPVQRNGTNILSALLEMGGDAGREQRRQMQETHTFEKAAAWIDRGIGVFGDLYDAIRGGFKRIWDFVSIDALMHPIDTFNQIYAIFAGPVGRVLDFVRDALVAILAFIKEALMTRLSTWARTIRGYPLITVLIGKDPFTNATVPRSIENIIRGFMSLMEGGEEQFNQLQQSGAIGRTVQRITAAVARLNMTPEYVVQLFLQLWDSFSFADLASPMAAFERIMAKFGEPIRRLVNFIIEIVKIVVEVVMQIMNFPSDLIANIIARAMQAFEMIKRDPVGFLKNLLRAIKQGFLQFFGNIGRHLLAGLQGWLMSELADSGVQAPTDFTLRGIVGWVLQLLGITMDKIWEKLAQHPRIGPERVAKLRGMIDKLEGIWTFIKDVQQRGMAAIWEKIQEKLSNLWETLLDAIKNWIMEQVVNRVTAKLLSMLDPTGIMAVINGAIALYNAVQSFIKYLRQMLEIVNSFVEGVVQIASGNISVAANFLERSMARGVPIMIGFLANQVGLSGLGRRIGEMVGKVRAMVDQALTWLVNKAVDTGMGMLDRLMGAAGGAAGGPDTRTMEQKQTAVDQATTEAQALLDAPNANPDQVRQRLPELRTRYRLNRIEIKTGADNQSHVEVEINPKRNTRDRMFGPFLLRKDDYIQFKRGNGRSFGIVLDVRTETGQFDFKSIGFKSNTTFLMYKLADQDFNWWKSSEDAIELPRATLEAENAKEVWNSYPTANKVLNWRRSDQQRNRDQSKQWEHIIEQSTGMAGINSSANLAWTDASFNQDLNIEMGRPRAKSLLVGDSIQWMSWREYLRQVNNSAANQEFKQTLFNTYHYQLVPHAVSTENPRGFWQELRHN